MTALELIGVLAGGFVTTGLGYAVVAGVTAGLRDTTKAPDATVRDLILNLPVVLTPVEPCEDTNKAPALLPPAAQSEPAAPAWGSRPPGRKPGGGRR